MFITIFSIITNSQTPVVAMHLHIMTPSPPYFTIEYSNTFWDQLSIYFPPYLFATIWLWKILNLNSSENRTLYQKSLFTLIYFSANKKKISFFINFIDEWFLSCDSTFIFRLMQYSSNCCRMYFIMHMLPNYWYNFRCTDICFFFNNSYNLSFFS